MNDNKINKSSLKEAKANFEEIQNFAIEEATKKLQEDVSRKVIELMNNSFDKTINEEVTINADGTTITIDDSGNVSIDAEGDVEDLEGLEGEEPVDMDSEEIVVSDEDDEIEIDNSEIDEMNLEEMNFEEQEVGGMPAAPAPEAAPVADEMPMDEVPMDEIPAEESVEEVNPLIQPLMDKMEQLMAMMGGNAPAGGGEEIDIIDDTEAAAAPAPAPAAAPAPAPVAEEITFEVVNNEMEIPEMEVEDDILEIVGGMEDEEETMEEMHGVGHNLRHSNRLAKLPGQGVEHRKELNENKAQYEAKLAELIKENESLQSEKNELEAELIKFENGFIKLQENFGQMQDYNAKLVMAYKVAMSGGLTSDEKVQISEQFDKCDTVEDAEKLYKSIVNEHKIKVNKNPEKSIKSTSIKSTPAAKSVSQPLYESREITRMKELAGIKRN